MKSDALPGWIQQMQSEIKRIPPGSSVVVEDPRCPPPQILTFPLIEPVHFADQILEGLVGSAYEFYWLNRSPEEGFRQVIFHRLLKPYPSGSGLFAFMDSDRRDRMEGVAGKWRVKGRTTWLDQSKIPLDDRVYYFLGDVEKDFPWTAYPGDRVKVAEAIKDLVMESDWPLVPDRFAYIEQQYELRVFHNVLRDRRPEMDFFKFVKC